MRPPLLLGCLAWTARGADLYAVVNASRDASTDALLASYVAAVDRDLAPAAADAEALALEASPPPTRTTPLSGRRVRPQHMRGPRARPWRTRCWTRSAP